MGNRISIQFKNGEDESPVLFSHWGGEEFKQEAEDYVTELKGEIGMKSTNGLSPLDRLEPGTVMVDFIRQTTKDMKRVESDLYLGKDENDGDNSDNGHHIIELDNN